MKRFKPFYVLVTVMALALLLSSVVAEAAYTQPGSSLDEWAGVSEGSDPAQLDPDACPNGNCAPPISITKEFADPTATFNSGDDVVFMITVTKPLVGEADGFGSTTAAAANAVDFATVDVTDVLTPDCDQDVAALATGGVLSAGESVSYNCTALNVTADFTNEACVFGRTGLGQPFFSDPTTDCDQLDVVLEQPTGEEGCTPGFWKNHPDLWATYNPDQTVGSVFNLPAFASDLEDDTLLEALGYGGGKGNIGMARNLLRASVAAILNAEQIDVDYPLNTSDIIDSVNAALASEDRGTMETVKNELDAYNNLGCGIDAHGNPI